MCLSLKKYCVILGGVGVLLSVCCIGLSLFLVFGDPWYYSGRDTYSPNWEDVIPALLCSVVSLLLNICLIGGAKQYSKDIILSWIAWNVLLILIFWIWYVYNQLKHHGYVDWVNGGMNSCYFCDTDTSSSVGTLGFVATLVLILAGIPVVILHNRLRKRHLELTCPEYIHASSGNSTYGGGRNNVMDFTSPEYKL